MAPSRRPSSAGVPPQGVAADGAHRHHFEPRQVKEGRGEEVRDTALQVRCGRIPVRDDEVGKRQSRLGRCRRWLRGSGPKPHHRRDGHQQRPEELRPPAASRSRCRHRGRTADVSGLQRRSEAPGRGKAGVGRAGEHALQRGVDHLRDVGPQPPHRGGVLRQPLGHDRLGGMPSERRGAGEHLEEHAAEGVEVAPGVDHALAGGLLGAHVGRRADDGADIREPRVPGRLLCGHRDPEVGDEGVSAGEEDVLGLDVAVDHPGLVGALERTQHLAGDREGLVDRQPLLLPPAAAAATGPARTA